MTAAGEILPVALMITLIAGLLLKLVLDAHLLLEKALDGHSTIRFGALLAADGLVIRLVFLGHQECCIAGRIVCCGCAASWEHFIGTCRR